MSQHVDDANFLPRKDFVSSSYLKPRRRYFTGTWEYKTKPHKGDGGWEVGDVVRLVNGTAPAVVTEIDSKGYILNRKYVGSLHVHNTETSKSGNNTFISFDEVLTEYQRKLIENCLEKLNQGETTMAKDTLYEIKEDGKSRYATKLAVNSAGSWVMEERGSGLTIEVLKDNLKSVEEVMPYTVGVQFSDNNNKTYHFFAEKDQYKKGSFYLMDGLSGWSVVQVTDVGTKSRLATKELEVLGEIALDRSMVKG